MRMCKRSESRTRFSQKSDTQDIVKYKLLLNLSTTTLNSPREQIVYREIGKKIVANCLVPASRLRTRI